MKKVAVKFAEDLASDIGLRAFRALADIYTEKTGTDLCEHMRDLVDEQARRVKKLIDKGEVKDVSVEMGRLIDLSRYLEYCFII